MRTSTSEQQKFNQAAEQLWKNGLYGAADAAQKADYFLKQGNMRLRTLIANQAVPAGKMAEYLFLTGSVWTAEVLFKSSKLGAAAVGTAAAMHSESIRNSVEGYVRSFGIPRESIAQQKVFSSSNINQAQKMQYHNDMMQFFELVAKNQQSGLSPTQQAQLNTIQQHVTNLESIAEADFQKRKEAQSFPADIDDLDALTALNAKRLNQQSNNKLNDLRGNQELLNKLKNPNISPEEYKSTQEKLKQHFQNQQNNPQDYFADIAQGQHLADLNQFNGGQAVAEQSRAMAQGFSRMMEAMESLSNQQLGIHGATLQHITYEHGITRQLNAREHTITRQEIQKVGALVGQVSDQVYQLTQFVVTFANAVIKGLTEIIAGQKVLGELIENSTRILAEAIYRSHQELKNEIRAVFDETHQARKEIHMARHEIRNVHHDMIAMDLRLQERLLIVFSANYKEIKDELLTHYVRWGNNVTAEEITTFRRYLNNVIRWATHYAKDPMFNDKQAEKYSNDIAMQQKVIAILSEPGGFENNINFLVGYFHYVFGIPYNRKLVNAFAWSDAALLSLQFPNLLPGFSNNPDIKKEIGRVIAEGREIIHFLTALQTDLPFFEMLLSGYEIAVKNVSGEIGSLTVGYLKENIIKKAIVYYNDQLKNLNAFTNFFQNMHSALLGPHESIGYAWPKDKNPIGFDTRDFLQKGKNISYVRSNPLTFDAKCKHQDTVAFACTKAGNPIACTVHLADESWSSYKYQFLKEHPEESETTYHLESRVFEGNRVKMTSTPWRKSITGTKTSLKNQCWSPYVGITRELEEITVNQKSYQAIKDVLEKPLLRIEKYADSRLFSLIAQIEKRKNQTEAVDYQLPFDVFQNASDAFSTWKGELYSLDNYTHFFLPTSYAISPLFTDLLKEFSEKNKEIVKLWLQAEFLGLGKIQYVLTSKPSTKCASDITYSLEMKFSGKNMSAGFTTTFTVYLPNVKTLSDCVLDLAGFLETPCGIAPGDKMYRAWVDYHYREKHKITPEAFFSANDTSLKKVSHDAQSIVNDELVVHRQAIAKSVSAQLSKQNSTAFKKLIAVDVTVKRIISVVSLTHPELLDDPAFNRLLSELYDKEKIEKTILDYQKNPTGMPIHQALENMLTTSFDKFKTFVLDCVKQSKMLNDEEMLEPAYPLVQNTLDDLNALDQKHFSFGKQQTYSAVEIYRIYRYDDQAEKQILQEQKINLLVTNKQGNTAVHLAAKFGDINALHALLAVVPKESMNLVNRHKQSLIDLAMTIEDATLREKILVTLIKKGVTRCSNHLGVARFLNDRMGLKFSKDLFSVIAIFNDHYHLCSVYQSPTSFNASALFAGKSHPVSEEMAVCESSAVDTGWAGFFTGFFNWNSESALQGMGSKAPAAQNSLVK
ncbi:MAG: hypothetical protein A3E82_03805 [Gammaproteobacteria bacterium RIFCSPHIGHO2_12_FULL_38_11]|nr:MAG: hypothetical protein A3E82_03805 [Gammaproteobacteria bacterium RIFCSPHIGHO2_12_FULL_38_11]